VQDSVDAWANEVLTDNELLTRHTGQVQALREVFSMACTRLESKLPALEANDPYAACDWIDAQVSYLQSAIDYYVGRVAQHRKPRDGAGEIAQREALFLRAADELAWSCYRALHPRQALPPKPPPLTFFAARGGLWALEHDKGFEYADEWGSKLEEAARMPLRLVGIPRWMAGEPWSLLLVVHELAHHVIRERKLHETMPVELSAAAGDFKGTWKGWIEELLADLFATAAAGRDYVAALAEFLRADPARMKRAYSNYPPAYVRLDVLVAFLELRGDAQVRAHLQLKIDDASKVSLAHHLKAAAAVARAAFDSADLAGFWIQAPDNLAVATRELGHGELDAAIVNAKNDPLKAIGTPVTALDEPRLWSCAIARWWLGAERAFADAAARARRATAELALVACSAEGGVRAGQDVVAADACAEALLGLGEASIRAAQQTEEKAMAVLETEAPT